MPKETNPENPQNLGEGETVENNLTTNPPKMADGLLKAKRQIQELLDSYEQRWQAPVQELPKRKPSWFKRLLPYARTAFALSIITAWGVGGSLGSKAGIKLTEPRELAKEQLEQQTEERIEKIKKTIREHQIIKCFTEEGDFAQCVEKFPPKAQEKE